MRSIAVLLCLPACTLELASAPATTMSGMDVTLETAADGTTQITGCWAREHDVACTNGGNNVMIRQGPHEIATEFELASISVSGRETGWFRATTALLAPDAPTSVVFDDLEATIAIPAPFELLEPASGTTVAPATSIVHVGWTAVVGDAVMTIAANYRCSSPTSSRSATVVLATLSDEHQGTDVDVGPIADAGETCDIDVIVRRQHAAARQSSSHSWVNVEARQERKVAIRLVP